MPMLMINTMKEPLNDKRFRRALATAIDYTAIRQFAVSNYTSTLKAGLIMPTGLEGKFINDEDTQKYGVNLGITDEAERLNTVKQMLSEAGFKSVWKKDGTLDHMENAKGETLPTLFITSPAGWTDWEAMVTIAVEGMRKAGIDVREGFVDGGQYWPAKGTGNFDLLMDKPSADVSPSLPWSRFNEVMSSLPTFPRLSRGAASTKSCPAATGSRSAPGPVRTLAVTTSRVRRNSVRKWISFCLQSR